MKDRTLAKNRERRRAYAKEYYHKNKEKQQRHAKAWKLANPERFRGLMRRFHVRERTRLHDAQFA
jgi:hypothetical protein